MIKRIVSRLRGKTPLLFIVLSLIFVCAIISAMLVGPGEVSVLGFIKALLSHGTTSPDYLIIMHIRFPRIVASALAGAALAVSGAVLQGVLGNPLAGPNIIGINSGAGLGAILAMSVLPVGSVGVPVAAFLGALATSLLILLLATEIDLGKTGIVLVGVAVSSIVSAAIDVVKTVIPDSSLSSGSFMIGGFSGVSWSLVLPAVPMIAIAMICVFSLSRAIDVLSLGTASAQSLGLNVKLVQAILVICASLLAGSAVSFSGLLGFVGLIAPHIARSFTGCDHRRLLPCAALLGAALLTFSDTLARTLFSPYEIPVGIVMSLIGGPFFIFLLVCRRRELY